MPAQSINLRLPGLVPPRAPEGTLPYPISQLDLDVFLNVAFAFVSENHVHLELQITIIHRERTHGFHPSL